MSSSQINSTTTFCTSVIEPWRLRFAWIIHIFSVEKDRLGIISFLLRPVQRLPRYQLILSNLARELMKNLETNKEAVAGCFEAEKSVQTLLNIVNKYCDWSISQFIKKSTRTRGKLNFELKEIVHNPEVLKRFLKCWTNVSFELLTCLLQEISAWWKCFNRLKSKIENSSHRSKSNYI